MTALLKKQKLEEEKMRTNDERSPALPPSRLPAAAVSGCREAGWAETRGRLSGTKREEGFQGQGRQPHAACWQDRRFPARGQAPWLAPEASCSGLGAAPCCRATVVQLLAGPGGWTPWSWTRQGWTHRGPAAACGPPLVPASGTR
jgi:hypothetical protein